MPRSNGVYSEPAGTKGTPNTTIQSAPYNSFVDDLVADMNGARPITAGGTGATNATAARVNLGADNADNLTKGTVQDARLPISMAGKTFTGQTTITGMLSATGGSVELGRVDGVASTPNIDFHSGAVASDYDARFFASGGTGGAGGGSLTLIASAFAWGSFPVVRGDGGAYDIIAANAAKLGNQLPSYYTDISARLGFTPVNKAGDTGVGTTLFGTASAGALIASTGSIDLCSAQPYIDLKNSNSDDFDVRLALVAGVNLEVLAPAGTMKLNGSQVWTAGTDGPTSGLDADLLDGQHGAYFADIPARLGYTPVKKSGDTGVGTTTFGTAATGTFISSQGTIELTAVTPLIDLKENQADDYDIRIALSGGVDLNIIPANPGASVRFNGSRIWSAADHAANASQGITGYEILPSGSIRQWGLISADTEADIAVIFPVAFPTACLGVTLTPFGNPAPTGNAFTVSYDNLVSSGMAVRRRIVSAGGTISSPKPSFIVSWSAWGH